MEEEEITSARGGTYLQSWHIPTVPALEAGSTKAIASLGYIERLHGTEGLGRKKRRETRRRNKKHLNWKGRRILSFYR